MESESLRGWTRRHFYVILAFIVGMTLGVSLIALIHYAEKSETASRALRYGAEVTGNPDFDEDLVWFFCGSVVGGGIATLAAWRDSKAKSAGLLEEDVLNRLIADPKSRDDR